MSVILTVTSKVRNEIIPMVEVVYHTSEVEAYKSMLDSFGDFMGEYVDSDTIAEYEFDIGKTYINMVRYGDTHSYFQAEIRQFEEHANSKAILFEQDAV
jgi:hypothetical protein